MAKERFEKYNYMKFVNYFDGRKESKIILTLNEITKMCYLEKVLDMFYSEKTWYNGKKNFMKRINEKGYKTERPKDSLKNEEVVFIKINDY